MMIEDLVPGRYVTKRDDESSVYIVCIAGYEDSDTCVIANIDTHAVAEVNTYTLQPWIPQPGTVVSWHIDSTPYYGVVAGLRYDGPPAIQLRIEGQNGLIDAFLWKPDASATHYAPVRPTTKRERALWRLARFNAVHGVSGEKFMQKLLADEGGNNDLG